MNLDEPPTRQVTYLLDADQRKTVPNGPVLIDDEGDRVELPPKVFEVVQSVVAAFFNGMAVTVGPIRPQLSVEAAAHALGYAPGFVYELIECGEIPSQKGAASERVRIADLIDYANRESKQREEILTDLFAHEHE